MCGRLRVGKDFLDVCSIGRCAHVFGLCVRHSRPLAIVTFPVSLIGSGQPIGKAALIAADAFASVFSVAFFAAFALSMTERSPNTGPLEGPGA